MFDRKRGRTGKGEEREYGDEDGKENVQRERKRREQKEKKREKMRN